MPETEVEARQLRLPKPLHSPFPHISSLLYDPISNSLALRHSDSSYSLYPSFSPFSSYSSFPSPQSLVPSPTSSAAFLHLQTAPNSTTSLFITSSPLLRPSPATLLRFYIQRGDRFTKIKVVSSHRDLGFDATKAGVVFKVSHGVSMKLSGGINVFCLYSISNSKIWVFAVRLVADDDGGGEALKLMKCAVIDCCFNVFAVEVLFGFLFLGEENGVRIFPLRPLVKGKHRKEKEKEKEKKNSGRRLNSQNGLSYVVDGTKVGNGVKTLASDGDSSFSSVKGDKQLESVKLRPVKLRQDSKDMGAFFVAFKDKDIEKSSTSVKMSVRMKAISIRALSANRFVILDSVGDIHLLHVSYSITGFYTASLVQHLTQTIKALKMAVFGDVSAETHKIWISDGSHTMHLMILADVDEAEKKDSGEKLVQSSVAQAVFTSEKVQHIVPLGADSVLALGQESLFAYAIS